jgi:hypothetical protein
VFSRLESGFRQGSWNSEPTGFAVIGAKGYGGFPQARMKPGILGRAEPESPFSVAGLTHHSRGTRAKNISPNRLRSAAPLNSFVRRWNSGFRLNRKVFSRLELGFRRSSWNSEPTGFAVIGVKEYGGFPQARMKPGVSGRAEPESPFSVAGLTHHSRGTRAKNISPNRLRSAAPLNSFVRR